MHHDELTSLQRSFRQMLPGDGIAAVLAALKKALPEQTDKYNMVFQLETRLNAVNKDRIRGILSQEELERAYNRLTADILDLIDGLVVADFEPATPAGAANKTGAVLYQIPHTMRVAEEARCVIRLAFEEALVVENIDLTKDTVLKPVRVSEVMEVTLTDPNETPAFAIRRISSAEQFLEKGAYTEWLFFVKPLRAGELPLMLVVAVKELIDNRERKREIVLEELIHVVTEAAEAVADTSDFQRAGYSFVYTSATAPDHKRRILPAILRNKLATLALVATIVAGVWAAVRWFDWFKPAPPPVIDSPPDPAQVDSADWRRALALGTDSSFYYYLEQHPDGIFIDEAQAKLDSLEGLQDTITLPVERPQVPSRTEPKTKKPDRSKGRKSGFTMVAVKGGRFTMGNGTGRTCAHPVRVRDFKIGQYEVTQADWEEVTGRRHRTFNTWCPDCPVEQISWDSIQAFLQFVYKKTGKRYRLPHEAEWEYAARGGQKTQPYEYAGSNDPKEVAYFDQPQLSATRVGTKMPNELGLYDMSGNVQEWCNDVWKPYPGCKGNTSENKRVVRGGSWKSTNRVNIAVYTRSSMNKEEGRGRQTGFRLALDF